MDESEGDMNTDGSEADNDLYEPEDSEESEGAEDLHEDQRTVLVAKKRRARVDTKTNEDPEASENICESEKSEDASESEDESDVDDMDIADEVAEQAAGTERQRFSCSVCKKDLSSKINLKTHMRLHTGEKPFECDICQKKFTNSNTMRLHKRTHAGEKAFKCSVCQKGFNHSTNLTTHMRLHTGEKPYQCDVCQRAFTHSNTLKMHKRIHTGECPYKCTVCSDCFPRRDQLTRHMSLHTGMKPYPCKMCNKSFSQIDSLKTHMEIHTDIKPYECGVCQKKFASHVTLKRHMKNHNEKTFHCNLCEKKFVFKTELNRHMDTAHSDERPFECSLCNKTFQVANNLKKHMIVHTKEKPFKCPFCEKPFSTKNRMNVHKRLEHTKQGLHECEVCSRMFPFPANLRKHMMSHTSYEKKYPCDVCGKAFTNNYNLVIHVTTHTGVKLFPCPICKKEFSYPKTMKDHAMVHFDTTLLASGQSFTRELDKDEKLCLKCPFCLKEFSYYKHYRAHMRLHPESSFLQIPNSEDSPQTCESSDGLPGGLIKKEPTDPAFDADATSGTSDGVLQALCVSRGDETIYRCPVCDIETESKLFIRAHMFIHYDIGSRGKKKKPKRKLRPFKCVLCPKTFVAMKYLRRHKKRCHSEGSNSHPGSSPLTTANEDDVILPKVEPESSGEHKHGDISSQEPTIAPLVERSPSLDIQRTSSNNWTYRFENTDSLGSEEGKSETVDEHGTSGFGTCDIDVKPLVQTHELNTLETSRLPNEVNSSQTAQQINELHNLQTTRPTEYGIIQTWETNDIHDSKTSLQPKTPDLPFIKTEKRVLVETESSSNKPKKKRAKARTPMSCSVCGRTFVYTKSFQNHLQEHEENRIKSTFQVKPPGPVKVNVMSPCQVTAEAPCETNFQDSGQPTTRQVKKTETKADPLTTDVKPILCNKCGEVFPDDSALQVHQLLHLPNLSLNLFSCYKCGQKFGNASALVRHEAVHQD